MKINYKSTALNFLDSWTEHINVPESFKPMTELEGKGFGKSVINMLQMSAEVFKKNTRFISESFMEAYLKGRHKLAEIFNNEVIDESGVLIYKKASTTHTIFYHLKTVAYGKDWDADFVYIDISKHTKHDFKSIEVCLARTRDYFKSFIYKGHFDDGLNEDVYISFLVRLLCFIKYAEIQTKVIKPLSKESHIGIKYVNETKQKIEILDSTWFTNIVREDGFSVRGHFRFQACGPGLSQRKLIWVPEFEKNGYVRIAKMIGNEPGKV